MRGLIPLPSQVDRFIRLPSAGDPGAGPKKIRFVMLEDLVGMFLQRVFPGFSHHRPGPIPPDPRHRHRVRGGSRGPGADVRDGVEAAAAWQRSSTWPWRCRACREALVDLVADSVDAGRTPKPACRPGPDRRGGPQAADRGRPAGPAVHPLHAALPRNASAISAATASPPSAPRTSSSIIRSRASTWWCSFFARRLP